MTYYLEVHQVGILVDFYLMNLSISLTFLFHNYATNLVPRSIDTTIDEEMRAATLQKKHHAGESSVSTPQGGNKSKATKDLSSQSSLPSIPREHFHLYPHPHFVRDRLWLAIRAALHLFLDFSVLVHLLLHL